MISNIVLYL